MDDSITHHEQHNQYRRRIRRARRKIGLRSEDYFPCALALIVGVLLVTGILWFLNRPKTW